jgi:hypothetical protein
LHGTELSIVLLPFSSFLLCAHSLAREICSLAEVVEERSTKSKKCFLAHMTMARRRRRRKKKSRSLILTGKKLSPLINRCLLFTDVDQARKRLAIFSPTIRSDQDL